MHTRPTQPNEIFHYGMPRRSGRYPWGSGASPFQGDSIRRSQVRSALSSRNRGAFEKDHKVLAGTVFYRTSTNKQETFKGSTYVTYLGPERDLYRGGYIRMRDGKSIGETYEYKMVSKKDLNVAGRDSIKAAITTSLKKDPKLFHESVEGYLNILIPKGSIRRYLLEMNPATGEYDKTAWKKFVNKSLQDRKNQTIEEGYGSLVRSLGASPKLKQAIATELKKQGYDAMTDEAGVGGKAVQGWREGIDPLIVFDGKGSFDNITSKPLKVGDEWEARQRYLKWQGKSRNKAITKW